LGAQVVVLNSAQEVDCSLLLDAKRLQQAKVIESSEAD
jgi:hypothetical protein